MNKPIFWLFPFCFFFLSFTGKIDSLTTELQKKQHDTTLINTLNLLAWEIKSNHLDSAIKLSNQALSLAQKRDWQKGSANSLRNLGAIYYLKGDYPRSLSYFFDAVIINEKLNDKFGQSATLGNIGLVYASQGEYSKALEYYFKSLKIDEVIGRKSGIAANLSNIGIAYYYQKDFSKALEYYFKSLKAQETLENKYFITNTYGNIGNAYYSLNEYSKAFEYFSLALKADKESGNKNGIAIWQGNIGLLNISTNHFNEAEAYLDSAILLQEFIGCVPCKEKWYKSLSKLHDTLAQIAMSKSQWQEAAKRYKLAYKHHLKYSETKDTLFNEEKSKDIGRLEQKHVYEIAEVKRKQKEEEIKKQELEIKIRRNTLQYSGIVIGLFVIGLIVALMVRMHVPPRVIEGGLFIAFLVFFEFLLVLLDPYIEQFTGGAPAWKLFINAVVAGVVFPLHNFFEYLLKKKLLAPKVKTVPK